MTLRPFTVLTAIAAPMLRNNIDTDAIIPSRESTSVSRDGYGEKLFANWRYQPGGRVEIESFVLNRAPYRRAQILLAGDNFGCGSSREAAVWSLAQFGIRCVIARGFGDIFRGNCIRNGLLPVTLAGEAVEVLAAQVEASGGTAPVSVDLTARRVTAPDGTDWSFEIDALDREMLLEGLDAIDLSLKHAAAIAAFQARDRAARPWIYARPDKAARP
jgi:3-isopropylmalate/(R)-2-methylmalate dehydratase small subunit